ncbi:acyl carrier protein [Actinokineospora terrae]|uniref:Phosphopantetheine attachment site n=1 Tax=Actinokineospora terrae TaxID=155974 RepID=A0A1H9MFE2_9PSEU|nr:acyl carrier protein [Actinokineospora terrae]SER22368.1 Phosphopantetheine attachment site [Actinokineospora terrae]
MRWEPADRAAAVAAIWREVLNREAVDPDDDFFAVGGTSLAAVKFLAEVEEVFGIDVLTPEDLYRGSTFTEVLAVIEANSGAAVEPSAALGPSAATGPTP